MVVAAAATTGCFALFALDAYGPPQDDGGTDAPNVSPDDVTTSDGPTIPTDGKIVFVTSATYRGDARKVRSRHVRLDVRQVTHPATERVGASVAGGVRLGRVAGDAVDESVHATTDATVMKSARRTTYMVAAAAGLTASAPAEVSHASDFATHTRGCASRAILERSSAPTMTLIPIGHERRLASPAEAERFFRKLGEKIVSARGFHTTDPERMARIVAAVEPKREHTVSFETGTFDAAARSALDALAGARFGYLDVRTHDANLRIWPNLRSWVHARGTAATASVALGAALRVGDNALEDATMTIADDDRFYPIDVKTESAATATRIFHALAGEHVDRGFIAGIHERTKPLLER